MELYASDSDLIAGCLAKERRAWNTFVQRHTRYIFYLIEATRARYGAALSDEDKADLHSNIFAAFVEDDARRLRDFEGRNQCSLRSWVRMITIRKTIDHLRKKKHRLVSMNRLYETKGYEPVDEGHNALDLMVATETAQEKPCLAELKQMLSEQDRLLLELLLVEKLAAPEIARTLQISVGAVYTRKNRLIERLKRTREKNDSTV